MRGDSLWRAQGSAWSTDNHLSACLALLFYRQHATWQDTGTRGFYTCLTDQFSDSGSPGVVPKLRLSSEFNDISNVSPFQKCPKSALVFENYIQSSILWASREGKSTIVRGKIWKSKKNVGVKKLKAVKNETDVGLTIEHFYRWTISRVFAAWHEVTVFPAGIGVSRFFRCSCVAGVIVSITQTLRCTRYRRCISTHSSMHLPEIRTVLADWRALITIIAFYYCLSHNEPET